ncbi:MAG: undecaprenyldiphospho-muramoylpentapeptide beta-N-acetylglucosaminyltransferase [Lachnospiraceae bacterium]|nr:undecaprenyldiphospho-muramoylpentapeptide beta-N-acetylglucosaminyltransferase [Lachnospiraceae bacterium]MBQ9392063.1 undecaprenyldiphospho-muramoylpentapeptide beta-N-acetylglucosaminyltransferase [Lachnospiraceae bacterium]
MKKIIMTGGGTAGHVTPNIALFPALKEEGYEISYIGSYNGIEKELIKKQGIEYFGISSGKLRRYFDVKNFTDPFRVMKGYSEAKKILKHTKPDVVFSKGGFVTVPVVYAAKKLHIPVIIHESDLTPGLANKLAIPNATYVCHNFPETANHLPEEKSRLTGCPIRKELFEGDREKGLKFLGFQGNKPVLMIIGGSTGAKVINETVRESLDILTQRFDIVHLCGKDKLDTNYNDVAGYKQFEYISDELNDIFAASDVVISRAGANAICELLALCKPHLLIPLSANASRGDQILNAKSFKKQGFSEVLEEENMTKDTLCENLNKVYDNRDLYINKMKESSMSNPIETIVGLIKSVS